MTASVVVGASALYLLVSPVSVSLSLSVSAVVVCLSGSVVDIIRFCDVPVCGFVSSSSSSAYVSSPVSASGGLVVTASKD